MKRSLSRSGRKIGAAAALATIALGGFGSAAMAAATTMDEVTLTVYGDTNSSGTRDSSEEAVANASYTLKDSAGNTLATGKTDADGNIIIVDKAIAGENLLTISGPNGDYTFQINLSSFNPAMKTSVEVAYNLASSNTTSAFTTVNVSVFEDTDENQTLSGSDTALANRSVTITQGSKTATAKTNSQGRVSVADTFMPGAVTIKDDTTGIETTAQIKSGVTEFTQTILVPKNATTDRTVPTIITVLEDTDGSLDVSDGDKTLASTTLKVTQNGKTQTVKTGTNGAVTVSGLVPGPATITEPESGQTSTINVPSASGFNVKFLTPKSTTGDSTSTPGAGTGGTGSTTTETPGTGSGNTGSSGSGSTPETPGTGTGTGTETPGGVITPPESSLIQTTVIVYEDTDKSGDVSEGDKVLANREIKIEFDGTSVVKTTNGEGFISLTGVPANTNLTLTDMATGQKWSATVPDASSYTFKALVGEQASSNGKTDGSGSSATGGGQGESSGKAGSASGSGSTASGSLASTGSGDLAAPLAAMTFSIAAAGSVAALKRRSDARN